MSLFGMPPLEPNKPKAKNGQFEFQKVYVESEIVNLREIAVSLGKRCYLEETKLSGGSYQVKIVVDSDCYYNYIIFEMDKFKKIQDELNIIYNKKKEEKICAPDIDWSNYDRVHYDGNGTMY